MYIQPWNIDRMMHLENRVITLFGSCVGTGGVFTEHGKYLTDDEIKELCQPTVDEIKSVIGLDYRKSLAFLAGFSLTEDNCFTKDTESYVKALMIEPDMINDPFIRRKIYSMIRKRIEMGERGAIRINANFAMISGDPYALLQSIFGLEITGLLKAGEVYHKYWIDKGAEEIACFRAPMT